MRTQLQKNADEATEEARRRLAEDLRRFREDAGLTQRAVAAAAGVDPSIVSRLEANDVNPTLETYARVVAALGGNLSVRAYPGGGSRLKDRHQVRMADLVLPALHARWGRAVEVRVRTPVSGWIDLALHDPASQLVVASEFESDVARIERLIRWSVEKAAALPSAAQWAAWRSAGDVTISRLVFARWTRANRLAVADARRLLREAFPADPPDAVAALRSSAPWPGPALVWVRTDGPRPGLLDARW